MFQRAYCTKFRKRQPTYEGVTVCKEWLTFSVFRGWMEKQDWRGKALDKDIIRPGNKEYGPHTCCFVTNKVNSLLLDNISAGSEWPRGVTASKSGRFTACCAVDGKSVNLGTFDSPDEASQAYRVAKYRLLMEAASGCGDEVVAKGLRGHAGLVLRGETTKSGGNDE